MKTKVLSGKRKIQVEGKSYKLVPQGGEYTPREIEAACKAIASQPELFTEEGFQYRGFLIVRK